MKNRGQRENYIRILEFLLLVGFRVVQRVAVQCLGSFPGHLDSYGLLYLSQEDSILFQLHFPSHLQLETLWNLLISMDCVPLLPSKEEL